MALESACIPVPSEATALFAGFNVSEGNMTLFGIVAAGVLGNVAGSWPRTRSATTGESSCSRRTG